ncbi:MAG: sulfatase [Opitutales bacterium]
MPLLLATLLLLAAVCPSAEVRRPDIVVFLTDDLGRLDTAPYGGGGIRTPHVAALAAAGLTFDRAYVASPSCAPSRAALLTGLMPARNGASSNHAKPRAEIRKWPSYFKELGYEVAAFGKVSHYRHTADYGFDVFAHDTFHDPEGVPAALKFLRERPKDARPLCLMVGSNWPHVPWPVDDKTHLAEDLKLPAASLDTPQTRVWRARYADAVARGDAELGEVMRAVREKLPPSTMIVFTSDHGAQWPFGKWNLYEAGVATPLIVSWPGKVAAGTRTAAMVSWVDLLPTLLEAAGGKAPADIDGRSFLPALQGGDRHRDRIFTTHSNDNRMNVYPARAVRDGRWKYVRNLRPEWAFTTHIDLQESRGDALGQRAFFAEWEALARTDAAAATLARYHRRPAEELYDLEQDPAELTDVATVPANAAKLAELRAALDAWMREQGDDGSVPVAGRPLSDPGTYGPAGAAAEAAAAAKRRKK